MTTDKVNRKNRRQQDITWAVLIGETEARLRAYKKEVNALSKSLVFFKKQESSGIRFPAHKTNKFRRLCGVGKADWQASESKGDDAEYFCGGRIVGPRRPRHKGISKQGRGTLKIPVVGMVQRNGDVRFQMLDKVTAENLSNFIAENADLTCRIITDDFNLYRKVGRKFAGGHEVVTHSAGEYVRPGTDIHSNSIEGVFSLIRRGVMGTFHSVSRKHLPNYLNEFQFRWNTRKMDDGERVARVIKQIDGKRLEYRESVENPPYLPKPSEPKSEQMEAPF